MEVALIIKGDWDSAAAEARERGMTLDSHNGVEEGPPEARWCSASGVHVGCGGVLTDWQGEGGLVDWALEHGSLELHWTPGETYPHFVRGEERG